MSATQTDVLEWLVDWYASQADGDWEHVYGIRIDTLDNPGWSLDIDLSGTAWEGMHQPKQMDARTEHDWCFTEVSENVFRMRCGPRNLREGLQRFRCWIEAHRR